MKVLVHLYNRCWESSIVPSAWKQASIKLKCNREPSNFCPIALTSCFGKIYTTIIKNRWLEFMKANQYFDKIQKAFMPSVPGWIEHYWPLL